MVSFFTARNSAHIDGVTIRQQRYRKKKLMMQCKKVPPERRNRGAGHPGIEGCQGEGFTQGIHWIWNYETKKSARSPMALYQSGVKNHSRVG
jgi:hypothetical protein